MTKVISSYNQWHLGDQLLHLNFLRRLALQHPDAGFVHYCDPKQHDQLRPVIQDLQNVQLNNAQIPKDAIDAWINTGAHFLNPGGWDFNGYWDKHPKKWDYVAFHIEHFKRLAGMFGMESPIKTPMDMLFDFPALLQSRAASLNFDFLVINSKPGSGQLRAYTHPTCFDPLIDRLKHKGYKIACTQATNVQGVFDTMQNGLSLTDIGNLSIRTPYIVGASTGPMWLTHNVRNVQSCKFRIVLLEKQRVHLPGNGCHVETFQQAIDKLAELKLI